VRRGIGPRDAESWRGGSNCLPRANPPTPAHGRQEVRTIRAEWLKVLFPSSMETVDDNTTGP
jgi:hypothetical protein